MIEGGYWWLMLGGMLFAPRLALGIWLCTVGHWVIGAICIGIAVIEASE